MYNFGFIEVAMPENLGFSTGSTTVALLAGFSHVSS
jgi:hypothetical protein